MESNINKKNALRDWWARFPQTYGKEHGKPIYSFQDGKNVSMQLSTPEFFDMVDKTFYSWNKPLHTADSYFGKIFDYNRYNGKNVLEVGCGLGTMAMNWAKHGALITAIDLNPVAVQQTKRRFQFLDLKGHLLESDGESLPFKNDVFDYAYSWGVLHHTPNIEQSIGELYRVIKPQGLIGVMLYHRYSLLYSYIIYFREGILHLENQFLTPLQLASRYTDGGHEEGNPHTWPVTQTEIKKLFKYFSDVQIKVLGTDLDEIFKMLIPGVGIFIPQFIRKAYARRWGWSLWITGKKK